MTIKEQLTRDLPKFFKVTEFSEVCEHYDKDKSLLSSDVEVNFIEGTFLENTSKKTRKVGEMHVRIDDLTREPKINDKIKINDIFWVIDQVFRVEFGVASLKVSTDLRTKY